MGVGVAACAVCCAGPIMGLLAAIGSSALLGTLLFGVVGAIAVAAVGLMLVGRRRRKRAACAVPMTVSLEAPTVGVGGT